MNPHHGSAVSEIVAAGTATSSDKGLVAAHPAGTASTESGQSSSGDHAVRGGGIAAKPAMPHAAVWGFFEAFCRHGGVIQVQRICRHGRLHAGRFNESAGMEASSRFNESAGMEASSIVLEFREGQSI